MTGELKAGFFVLAAIAALVVMTTKLTQNQYAVSGTKTYYANINDATGLLSNTKVKMAGLDVGQLKKLELVGTHARITLVVASDLALHKDGSIAVKAIGFLGDKYLELSPGSPAAALLEEGAYVREGQASGSLDQLTAKTTQLVDNLKEITDVLKESLRGNGEGADGTRLERILDNMEQFSQGLAEMDRLGDLADRLTEVASNVRDITGRVNRGEGTVDKLLTDTDTLDRINQTLSGVNKFITKADKLQVLIDARTGALTDLGGSRSAFSLILQPTYDKYYLFGITTRPQGITKTTTTRTVQNNSTPTTTEEKVTEAAGVGFNVQFAKRWGDATFRLGLFESTGGLGADYNFLEDKLKLTAELYRFGSGGDTKAQLNLTSEYSVYKPFFLWGGGDHVLSKDNRSFFVGAGLRFTDQDIKSLVTAAVTAGSR